MVLNFLLNLYSTTELKILAIAGIAGAAISRAIGGFDVQIEMLTIKLLKTPKWTKQ